MDVIKINENVIQPDYFIIETKRLIFRPFNMEDIVRFSEICANANVMRYIGDGKPMDIEMVKTRMESWIAFYETHNYGLMALTIKEDDQLIGFCGLIHQTVDGEERIELGYRLDEPFWGKGIATEAAIAVKEYAFNQLNIPMLISIIHYKNLDSKRVAEKVGMELLKKTTFKTVLVDIFCAYNPRFETCV